MKKIVFVALACLLASQILYASNVSILPKDPAPALVDIGYGVKIPAQDLLTLTPKQYKKLTGHRLGWVKSIGLKMAQKKMKKADDGGSEKSQIAAILLCFFLGGLGIHRFYLGYTWQGVVQLLTAGGLGIWWLIDFIRIIIGDLKPKHGQYKSKI